MPKIPEKGIDCITPAEERAFEEKAERMLGGHRGLIDGRDYRWNVMRFRDSELGHADGFHKKFDETFPWAPGSPAWFQAHFCKHCGKRKSVCRCAPILDFRI